MLRATRIYEAMGLAKDPRVALVSSAIFLVASAALVFGYRAFAIGKGYSIGFGYLGLVGLADVVILMFLPDRPVSARWR